MKKNIGSLSAMVMVIGHGLFVMTEMDGELDIGPMAKILKTPGIMVQATTTKRLEEVTH